MDVKLGLFAHLFAWVSRAIFRKGLAIPVESLVSHKEVQGNSIPHKKLILLEAGVLLDVG